MNFAFVTCVQIGLSCMEELYAVNGTLKLIITLHDEKAKNKSGRIYVDDFAELHSIPVIKVNHINDVAAVQAIKEYAIDWLFIIGWSQIASLEVINAPKYGAIGAHPTLLPQGRGRAAIPWAIIKGLDKTGVTFFKLDENVDTGLILAQQEIPLSATETATVLYEKVNDAHKELISKLYFDLKSGNAKGIVQDESLATYWEGRTPKDGEITLDMDVYQADRLVRATTKPYPGAYVVDKAKKIIIWEGLASIRKQMLPNTLELILTGGYYYATNFEIFDN
ncbi:methionyl-tRNA formyltransferase [Flavobacterium rivuli WB 3.3-2 = DSM 21788]|uniref:Methionyl-tRNA formyltransferase n=1 Tax=Flavobacterium rivuli WB 3.3-2 = DSM 21788 TaxID=1121895 RepID=A0A0A2M740_9FLAO|nr:formyltransferase family protein [Flavobacterium rivuli]KGO87456.1 methionyl-tRNA formyltransferase [Flavobacterium rivuli WB 3.3-2 = DSM 21788]